MKNFNKLCAPAKIYFAIAVIATIIALLNGVHMMYAFWKMVFAFIWTFVLGFLCNKGYTSISWLLVLLPYILIALAMFNIYQVTEEERQFMRAIKLQGPYGREAFVEGFKGFKRIKEDGGMTEGQKAKLGGLLGRAQQLTQEQADELRLRRAEEEARRAEEEARRAQDEARRLEDEARQAEIARQEAEIASIEETVMVEEPTNEAPSGSLSWWLGG
jgi:hypothetical protein